MTTIPGLPGTDTISGSTLFPVYQNGRTRSVPAADVAGYVNQIITSAAIQVNLTAGTVTLTLGNGQVIEGVVIS